MPRAVTVHTGIDAIAHALETAVCNKASKISQAYSRAAWLMLNEGFDRVLDDPSDREARARMQLGAAFAGTAIENSMLGIAHSCANPLTAHFGTLHGEAVGVMLPHVIRYNRQNEAANEMYDELGGEGLAGRIRELLERCNMATHIGRIGVHDGLIPILAGEAAGQWTAQFNPVPVGEDDLAGIYREAL